MICSRKGYKLKVVMPDNVTPERRQVAALFGAEIIDSPGHLGSNGAIAMAKDLAARDPRFVMPYQYGNPANPGAHERGTAQEIIHDLFTNTIEAADVLGDDKEFRDHIAGLRHNLLKPKIGRWGQLQEWEADKDDPKDDHRHVSHLFALYPGRQITRAGTPELAEAARVSLQARGDASTGWSRAWKINFWARLWDGDHAYTMLRSLLNVVRETKTIYGESGDTFGGWFWYQGGLTQVDLASYRESAPADVPASARRPTDPRTAPVLPPTTLDPGGSVEVWVRYTTDSTPPDSGWPVTRPSFLLVKYKVLWSTHTGMVEPHESIAIEGVCPAPTTAQ